MSNACSKHACMQHKLCIAVTVDCACPECETAFNEWAAERISVRINPAIVAAEKRAAYAEETVKTSNETLLKVGDIIGYRNGESVLDTAKRIRGDLESALKLLSDTSRQYEYAEKQLTLLADVLRVTERSELIAIARQLRDQLDASRAVIRRLKDQIAYDDIKHKRHEHELMQRNPLTAVGEGLDLMLECWGMPDRAPGETDVEVRERVLRGAPIPMRITCPDCGELHVDEGEFATKRHHTHSCQSCGLTWRPAKVDTVGVRFLPGFKNDTTVAVQSKQTELPLEPQS